MARGHQEINRDLTKRLDGVDPDLTRDRLSRSFPEAQSAFPNSNKLDPAAVDGRWARLPEPSGELRAALSQSPALEVYAGHIENGIGQVSLPVGLAGPVCVNGLHAKGNFPIPLATTEAALVASYNRGCQAINDAGGCRTILLSESLNRSPGFCFATSTQAAEFCLWLAQQFDHLKPVVEATSRFCRLTDLRLTMEGNHVYVHLDFHTGDASGQNMVTIASQAVCQWIVAHSPVQPRRWYVESNMSGDKKASMAAFLGVRGKKVTAEVIVPQAVVERRLRTRVDAIVDYWQMSALGGVMSGTIGIQGHFANGLAALFLATGQDVACVAEAAVGITRMEQTTEGDLYATVTLPNMIVGTVGGGTGLPSQSACLRLMGLAGSGHAKAFAEVAAALCLAGELSIIAALSAGHFAHAHAKLARGS